MSRKLFSVFALVAVMALVLSACGGGAARCGGESARAVVTAKPCLQAPGTWVPRCLSCTPRTLLLVGGTE